MANYAAVCAIAVIGTEEAYRIIDRKKMYDFLLSVKLKDGSFMAQADGEVDVRCCYCALAVAKLLNLLTPELKANVAEYVNSYIVVLLSYISTLHFLKQRALLLFY